MAFTSATINIAVNQEKNIIQQYKGYTPVNNHGLIGIVKIKNDQ